MSRHLCWSAVNSKNNVLVALLVGLLDVLSGPLQEPSSIQKIAEIDEHIGVAMSGLTADAKTLIDRARVETQVSQQQQPATPLDCLLVQSINMLIYECNFHDLPALLAATSLQL